MGDLDVAYERIGHGPPVLVIGGTGGDRRQRPALVERIPEARLEVFEGGQLFLLQDRRAWSAIADFLAG